ncbi:unnamed protein product [Prunus armeniaca]|uniref:NAC domain-containing protein n=1 Tax=Prunus armeniaca TaxID=36596 RepID=A0A6J5UMK7_PRUAR|nr:unnamed protein product [Prunus armeniaca]
MGGYQVPVGYRFTPSEEELLLHYLLPRVNGNDYPKGVVPDCDLYGTKEPWEIWRDFHHSSPDDQEDIYVFTTLKKKTPNGSRFCRTVGAAGTGVWKGEDSGKKIRACGNDIGIRKRFRYMNPGSPHDDRWIMLEFQLDESLVQVRNKETIVLCLVRKKETSGKSKLEERQNHEVDMPSRGEIQAQHVHDDQQQHIDASTYDQLRFLDDYLMNDVGGEQNTMVNPTLLAQYDQQDMIGTSTEDQLRVFEDFLMNDVEGEEDTVVNPALLAQYGQQGTSIEDQLRLFEDYLMSDIEG